MGRTTKERRRHRQGTHRPPSESGTATAGSAGSASATGMKRKHQNNLELAGFGDGGASVAPTTTSRRRVTFGPASTSKPTNAKPTAASRAHADPPTRAATESRAARAAKRQELKEAIDILKAQSGRVRTYEENKMILTYALQFKLDMLEKHEEITDTALAQHVGHALHVKSHGRHTAVAELLKAWHEDRAVIVTDRGPGAPIKSARKLKPEHLVAMEEDIEQANSARGRAVTVNSLRALLRKGREAKDNDPGFEGVEVTRDVVRYALKHFLGYAYGKIKGKKISRDAKRPDIIRQYLLDFANALELEKKGTHVIVYVDESYINQNIAPNYTFLKIGSDGKTNRASGKGKRVCILHAITKDGPLCTHDTTGEPHYGDAFVKSGRGKALRPRELSPGEHTAEYLFIGKAKGDYHDSMNAKNFAEWVEQRLEPTFEHLFPGKRMILVLDNAPFVSIDFMFLFARPRDDGGGLEHRAPPQVPPQHRDASADRLLQEEARFASA